MKILIVEDDQKIADFIVAGVKDSGFDADHFISGKDGELAAENNHYDAAIFDVSLPEKDGFSIVESLRGKSIKIPVLFLSARRDVHEKVKGLNVGGDDYLTKPFSMDELLARVNALVRRGSGLAESTILNYEDLSLDLISRKAKRGEEIIELQTKEFSLLELFMRSPKKPVSKFQILEKIFEYHFDPKTNIVDVLVFRLRSKIDDKFERKFIHTIRKVGYVLE